MNVRIQFICITGGLLLSVLGFSLLAYSYKDFDPRDAGLGLNTFSKVAQLGESQISSIGELEPIEQSIHRLREANQRVVLWLGASQLHAINAFEPGDQLAVAYANEQFVQRDAAHRFVQISLPNGNLYELLLYYLALREHSLLPDMVLLAMVYDDMREHDIRDSTKKYLPPITPRLREIGGPGLDILQQKYIEMTLKEEDVKSAPVERNAATGTPQELVEAKVVSWLQDIWEPYNFRNRLSAGIKVGLHDIGRVLRKGLPRGILPVPGHAKLWNLQALDSLIRFTKDDGVTLVLYVTPLRPSDEDLFYNKEGYANFREEIRLISEENDLHYYDLTPIIPKQYWGLQNSGHPDYFHFQDEGHRILGTDVESIISVDILGSKNVIQ